MCFMIIHVFSVLLSSFPLLGGSWGGGYCQRLCGIRQLFSAPFSLLLVFIFCSGHVTFLSHRTASLRARTVSLRYRSYLLRCLTNPPRYRRFLVRHRTVVLRARTDLLRYRSFSLRCLTNPPRHRRFLLRYRTIRQLTFTTIL